MSRSRASVLVLAALCAGCATAIEPLGADGITAMPDGARPDAAVPGCAAAFSGALATWNFAGQPGSQTSTSAMATAVGVTADPLVRSGVLTAVAGASSINASNWSTSATIDPTRFFALSITPPAGCAVTIDGIAIDARSSSTGPATATVATADNLQSVAIAIDVPSTAALSATATQALEIRIYGFGANSAAGTMRLQNTLTITGAIE